MSEYFEKSVWQELNRIANALEQLVELSIPKPIDLKVDGENIVLLEKGE